MTAMMEALRRPEAAGQIRVVLACFLTQSVAIGAAYGTFGPLLQTNVEHFGVSRAGMSVGMSVVSATMGGVAPLLGALLPRVSVRLVMMAAALLGFVGYIGLAVTDNFYVALVTYFLTGASMTTLAIVSPVVLISRWFATNRGKALAFANLPASLALAPYIVTELLPIHGRLAVIVGIGALHLLLIPACLLIINRPGQAAAKSDAPQAASVPAASSARILQSVPFWLVSVGAAFIAAAGSAFFVHIIPFGIEHGLTPAAASGLLAMYAVAGIAGTPIFGWLADRIGPLIAFTISAFGQALMWWAMLYTDGLALFVVTMILGMCVLPLVTLLGASLGALFGKDNVGLAMGYCYTIKLPFMFVYPPLVGAMADGTGSYVAAFMTTAALLAVAAIAFFAAVRLHRLAVMPLGRMRGA